MTISRRVVPLAALTLVAALAARAAAQPTESVWLASSGLLPTQVCPSWTLIDTAAAADPALGASGLTLGTATGEDMLFLQNELNVLTPNPLVIEGRLRFVSGSSSATNRGVASIVVTSAPSTGILFGINADEIFLTTDGDVRGQSASVDTDGAAHTYRIEITPAGAVTVFYDGAATLVGTTYASASVFGGERRIIWGEGANVAFGSHVWESFRHNAATCLSGTTTSTTVAPGSTTLPVATTTLAPPTTSIPGSTSTSTTGAGATSTTFTSQSTTTSTTLPIVCDDVQPGSLDALLCRLDVLEAEIGQVNGLGQFRPKLQSTLDRAIQRAREAATACTSGDGKTAARRMKQTAKFLQKMTHRLKGLSARKRLAPIMRADLIQVIESIRADAAALRRQPCS